MHALKRPDTGLSFRPLDEECLCFRAIALWNLKRKTEALDVVGVALANNPESSQAHRILGWMSIKRRDRNACIEHLTQSLRIDPCNVRAQLLWRKVKGTPLQKLAILARKCAIVLLVLYGALVPISVIAFFGSPDPANSPDLLLVAWAICLYGTMLWMLKRMKRSLADPMGFAISAATVWIFISLCVWMVMSTTAAIFYHRYESIFVMQTPWSEIIFLIAPIALVLLECTLRLRRQSPPISNFMYANTEM